MRIPITALAAAAALAVSLTVASAAGAETTITLEPSPGENSFAPRQVTTSISDARFRWVWGAGGVGSVNPHDVVQDDGLFRSGPPKYSGEYEVTASAGTFPYVCTVHAPYMKGTLSVRPEGGENYPRPFRVGWAAREAETGKRFDVRYRVERRRSGARRAKRSAWRTWRRSTKRVAGTFGRRGKPVRVRKGLRYRFKVRSKGSGRSDWSPPLVVGP